VIGTLIGMGTWGLALGNICRGFLPALLSISLTGLWPFFTRDRQRIFSLIRICSAVVGSHLIIWLVMLAPPVLVGSLAGVKELGIAQLSYNLLNTTMFISTIIQRICLSALAKLQNDKESFNNAVQQILQVLSVIYIPLVMIISSFSPWWVPIIYGEEWLKMDEVIFIAAMPITISALLLIFQSVFFSKGLASLVFKQNVLHAILYWVVMAFLASTYGGVSVPISHLIGMSAGYLFIKGYSKHCGKLNLKPIVSRFTIGVLIMILSWFLLRRGDFLIPILLWGLFLFFLFFTPYFHGKQMVMKIFYSLRKGTL
jgi:O-antigen/teichoic acid export membrane protein